MGKWTRRILITLAVLYFTIAAYGRYAGPPNDTARSET